MKHDSKQTKTAVILIIVLAAAIGFVVVRLKGGDEIPAPAKQPAAQQVSAPSVGVQSAAACEIARDPFEKPPVLRAALDARDAAGSQGIDVVRETPNANPYARTAPAIKPADVTTDLAIAALPAGGVPKTAVADPKPAGKQAGPRIELLATVKGSGGWSAVIKTEDSKTQVVDVGDIVGSGFKVVRIETERVVLTDGRVKVIAKRPQS